MLVKAHYYTATAGFHQVHLHCLCFSFFSFLKYENMLLIMTLTVVALLFFCCSCSDSSALASLGNILKNTAIKGIVSVVLRIVDEDDYEVGCGRHLG